MPVNATNLITAIHHYSARLSAEPLSPQARESIERHIARLERRLLVLSAS